MKISKSILVPLLVLGVFALSYYARESVEKPSEEQSVEQAARIVAMAPSSCEALYAVGLGEHVVGVSRFTKYPPEAVEKPKIGGYLDVDLEAIIRLQPTHVVLLKEQQDLAKQLESMGMQTVEVDHMSVGGILDSISILGTTFGAEKSATALRTALEKRIEAVRDQAFTRKPRRVLLSIGRELGDGKVNSLVAAGAAGYHQELLGIANLQNAYQGRENFPQLTREHLLRLNPDFIIDMANQQNADAVGEKVMLEDWKSLEEVAAVREGRVLLLVGDKHFVPGPRFVDTLEWIWKMTSGE